MKIRFGSKKDFLSFHDQIPFLYFFKGKKLNLKVNYKLLFWKYVRGAIFAFIMQFDLTLENSFKKIFQIFSD